MKKDWEVQAMPHPEGHTTFRASLTPLHWSVQSPCAGALTREPRDIWSAADHKVHHLLHCSGLSRLNSTVEEHQICSCYISSVLTNRIIICLYFKAKGKQLKRGFVQLSATSIFALRYAKGYGHRTARERNQHCGSTTSKRWSWAQSSA